MTEWSVRITGALPVPQGSMTCVGRGNRHNVQPSNKAELHRWRAQVVRAGRALPVTQLAGPIGVQVTFTLPRPASVPLRARPWPQSKGPGTGDIDKLLRAVLDGLTEAGLWRDDSQVCDARAVKAYPDTPGPEAADRLDQPGVVIRVWTLL